MSCGILLQKNFFKYLKKIFLIILKIVELFDNISKIDSTL